jgi:predicted MPP superfamily phosphohydrolase
MNALLASVLALRVRRWPRGPLLALLAVAGVVEAVALAALAGDLFALIHLAYLHVVVALPIAGAALLVRLRGRGGWTLRAAAVGALLLAPVGAYATFVEPFRLELERARGELPAERGGSQPLRIGVLADLQTADPGEHESEAVDRLMAQRPDLVLIPGDVYQGRHPERDLPDLRRLMARLAAPGGVFFVFGDADQAREIERTFAGSRVRVLVDQVASTRVRDRTLTIGGIRNDYRALEAADTIDELEGHAGRRDIRILLAHRPDAALRTRGRIDLTVAGHTHGGQVRLPLIGPPIILSDVPRDVGAGGLHTLAGGRRIYVSRGVGVERGHAPRVRLFARPEISLLELAG